MTSILRPLADLVSSTLVNKLVNEREKCIEEMTTVVITFKEGDDKKTAKQIVKAFIPQAIYENPLAQSVVEMALPMVVKYVAQIHASCTNGALVAEAAKKYLEELDPTRGFNKMLDDMMESLNKFIDSYSMVETSSSSPTLNWFLGTLLSKQELKPTIKDAIHSLIYICLQQALTPKEGQTVQERVVEYGTQLIDLYNASDAKTTSTAWLKQLLPEETLKKLLPEFLHSAMKYENISEWVLEPYIKNIIETIDRLEENAKDKAENIDYMQKFVKNYLLKLTKEPAPRGGLAGYGGLVKEVEITVLKSLEDENSKIGKSLELGIDGAVSQIIHTLEDSGVLDRSFLTTRLIASLPFLQENAANPDDMPTDGTEFNRPSASRLLDICFPNKSDLPIPPMIQNAVWNKAQKSLEKLVESLTEKKSRILLVLGLLIPVATDDEEEIATRRNELTVLNNDPEASMKKAERQMKTYMLTAAMKESDKKIDKTGLWMPLKWLAKLIVKPVTYLIVATSVGNRLWNFLSDDETDMKIRRFIWALSDPKIAQIDGDKDLLTAVLQVTFKDTKLLPWVLRGQVASRLSKLIGK